jgi:hypothetical protein
MAVQITLLGPYAPLHCYPEFIIDSLAQSFSYKTPFTYIEASYKTLRKVNADFLTNQREEMEASDLSVARENGHTVIKTKNMMIQLPPSFFTCIFSLIEK